jgi:nucleoside-diphosphate-sugar epimerase
MRVFVAGATGAIGRPLIPKLIEAGHEVTGMTRSEERAAKLREAGVRAAVCDVFDEEQVRQEVRAAGTEALVHELTDLPDALNLRDHSTYEGTNRLRREGTRILLDAAQAAGARRFVAQSIAFAYLPEGEWVKDEDAALMTDAPPPFGEGARTLDEMERAVVGADGLQGLVLRYGWFYGPGTYFASDGSTAAEVRRRRYPVVGGGQGVTSFIHVDDAADATVAAVERGASGIYNVVDDDPAPMREWIPEYAKALGAKRPFRVPAFVARLVAGKEAAAMATTLRGASNAKAKRELGWQPRHASWRQGFAQSLR